MNTRTAIALVTSTSAAALALDQGTKQIARRAPLDAQGPPVVVYPGSTADWSPDAPRLQWVHVEHIAPDGGLRGRKGTAIMTSVMAPLLGAAAVVGAVKLHSPWIAVGAGLVVGGGVGNTIDVGHRGRATDMIAIKHIGVANFADAALAAGTLLAASAYVVKMVRR